MKSRRESRWKWWAIAGVVVGFHLALLFSARPEHLRLFLPDSNAPSEKPAGPASAGAFSSGASPSRHALIAIQIEVESDEPRPRDETPADVAHEPSTIKHPTVTPHPAAGSAGNSGNGIGPADGLGDILGMAGRPRAGGAPPVPQTVPPRPLEITWPDTRHLDHCIGKHVDVRILVGVDGTIREVAAASPDVDADCIAAAITAARRIKFTPGRVGGRPAELWAQVRIDFQEKR